VTKDKMDQVKELFNEDVSPWCVTTFINILSADPIDKQRFPHLTSLAAVA
jgi:hypothetical protein